MVQKLGFFGMLQMVYAAVGTFVSMLNGFAQAGKNISDWSEEATASFVDEARDERALKNAQRKAQFQKELESLRSQGIDVTDANPKAIG